MMYLIFMHLSVDSVGGVEGQEDSGEEAEEQQQRLGGHFVLVLGLDWIGLV